jgi:hypothetical protein
MMQGISIQWDEHVVRRGEQEIYIYIYEIVLEDIGE